MQGTLFDNARIPLVLITEHNAQAISFQRHLGLPILLVGMLDALPEQPDAEAQPLFLTRSGLSQAGSSGRLEQGDLRSLRQGQHCIAQCPGQHGSGWPHSGGLFFRQDSLDRLVIGIRKVLQGEYWIPRHLLCDLVDYYRKGSGQPLRNQTLLTAREQEIVRHLMMGASSTEIADNLFVSENTIKSHLDNMFKKLNVKNRLQAVSWAKEYL